MSGKLYPNWPTNYEYSAIDLDTLFSNRPGRLNGNLIACSAPMRQISRAFSGKTEYFYRKGLGQWEGLAINIQDHGTILFAAPVKPPSTAKGEADANEDVDSLNEKPQDEQGASIWVSRDMRLTADEIAALIVAVTRDEQIKFLKPDTGEAIETPALLPLKAAQKPPRP